MSETITLTVYGDRLVVVYDDFVDTMVYKKPDGKVFAMKAPETHSERTRGATIMAIGTDDDALKNFKVGDRILLSWHSGVRLHLMDKIVYGRTWPEDLLRVIRTEEILTKMERIDGSDNIRGCEDTINSPV
jgi:co-chaperonin GroES (HSP10)